MADGHKPISEQQFIKAKHEMLSRIAGGADIRDALGWAHGLYRDSIISEEQERRLFMAADPMDEWGAPPVSRAGQEGPNPLAEAIGR